jgi:hypothetical protein
MPRVDDDQVGAFLVEMVLCHADDRIKGGIWPEPGNLSPGDRKPG